MSGTSVSLNVLFYEWTTEAHTKNPDRTIALPFSCNCIDEFDRLSIRVSKNNCDDSDKQPSE